MDSNLFDIFSWWIVFFSIGWVFFPFSSRFFASFYDKGYIFSKITGILLISYLAWILGSLHILPFNLMSLFALVGLGVMLNSALAFKDKTSQIIRGRLKIIVFEEALFTIGFIFWADIRSLEPSVHGLEKFMDFGFINSIMRSEFFPPKDMWLTPHSINYYYFGHLVTAVLTKLSGVNPAVTYNLMVAALFALTLSASFSIGSNLYHLFIASSQLNAKRYTLYAALSGLLSAFLVTLGGNLHTIYIFFKTYSTENPVPFWQLPLEWNPSGYWYPNATRFIPLTIHEFPLYSFVVSDLHGHVLDIPFVLLLMALLVKIFHQGRLLILDTLALGLLVGVFLMTNVLDGPIYLLVISLVVLVSRIPLLTSIKKIASITLLALAFSLPFWLAFKPFSQGIGVLCAPRFLINLGHLGPLIFEADHCAKSPLWMLSLLWGFPFFVFLGFLALNFKHLKSLKMLRLLNPTDLLALALALISAFLILIPELFYVKDIYPAHYRANTVFKFGYQAFIILGLATGYMMIRLLTIKPKTIPYSLYPIPLLIFFFLVAIYPYFAINSYYGGFKNSQNLNGLSYLRDLHPSDYEAISWLNSNVSGQPVILEGVGDSYTDYARISSNTGLPTVIGWPVHEWLWRGSYDEAGKRTTEAGTIYESQDINITWELLKKYRVSYVYIGSLERQKYPNLNENKFYNLGKIVFQSQDTRIYQLNKYP